MEISQLGIFMLAVYSIGFGAALGIIYGVMHLFEWMLDEDRLREGRLSSRLEEIKLPIIKSSVYIGVDNNAARILWRVWTVLSDILFMTLCGIAIILISYSYNEGRLRFVVVLGVALGFAVCRGLTRKPLMILSKLLAVSVGVLFAYAVELALLPIKLVRSTGLKLGLLSCVNVKKKGAQNEI